MKNMIIVDMIMNMSLIGVTVDLNNFFFAYFIFIIIDMEVNTANKTMSFFFRHSVGILNKI